MHKYRNCMIFAFGIQLPWICDGIMQGVQSKVIFLFRQYLFRCCPLWYASPPGDCSCKAGRLSVAAGGPSERSRSKQQTVVRQTGLKPITPHGARPSGGAHNNVNHFASWKY